MNHLKTSQADRFLSTLALIVSPLNYFLVLTCGLQGFSQMVGNLVSDARFYWHTLLFCLFFVVVQIEQLFKLSAALGHTVAG